MGVQLSPEGKGGASVTSSAQERVAKVTSGDSGGSLPLMLGTAPRKMCTTSVSPLCFQLPQTPAPLPVPCSPNDVSHGYVTVKVSRGG